MTPHETAQALGHGVWVQTGHIKMCEGDIATAVLLANLFYWQQRATIERDGYRWVARTYDDLMFECCIPERTARNGLKRLTELGLIETRIMKFKGNPTVHVRIVAEGFDRAVSALHSDGSVPAELAESEPSESQFGSGQSCRMDPADLAGTYSFQKVRAEQQVTHVNFVDDSTTTLNPVDDLATSNLEGGASSSEDPGSTSLRSVSRAREVSDLETRDEGEQDARARSGELSRTGGSAAVVESTTPAPVDGATAIARRVLAAWVEAVGKDPTRTKLNAKRLSKVRARLNEGYVEDDLIAAVRGIALSSWHMGNNPQRVIYNDMLVALRDGEQVEKFRDLFESGRGRRGSSGVRTVLDAFDAAGLDDDAELADFGGRR